MLDSRRNVALACALSGLAGYVDGIGFLQLGGLFVSFMSGNSTQLGVGLTQDVSSALLPAALIGSFVTGVVIGALAGHFAASRRRPVVLLVVAILLAAAAICHERGDDIAAVTVMAIAMGAENAVFERDGERSIAVTYMTGALVKLGQRIMSALLGGDRWAWIWHLVLWSGLVIGAAIGAAVYSWIGLAGLGFAATTAALMAIVVSFSGESD